MEYTKSYWSYYCFMLCNDIVLLLPQAREQTDARMQGEARESRRRAVDSCWVDNVIHKHTGFYQTIFVSTTLVL